MMKDDDFKLLRGFDYGQTDKPDMMANNADKIYDMENSICFLLQT